MTIIALMIMIKVALISSIHQWLHIQMDVAQTACSVSYKYKITKHCSLPMPLSLDVFPFLNLYHTCNHSCHGTKRLTEFDLHNTYFIHKHIRKGFTGSFLHPTQQFDTFLINS